MESFREVRDRENQREWREGADAENAEWSIKAMELLLCTLMFLWLTSMSADHVLPHKRDTHTLAQHTATRMNADMCTLAPCTCFYVHACTFRGVVQVCAKKNVMGHLRWHLSQRCQEEKRTLGRGQKQINDRGLTFFCVYYFSTHFSLV